MKLDRVLNLEFEILQGLCGGDALRLCRHGRDGPTARILDDTVIERDSIVHLPVLTAGQVKEPIREPWELFRRLAQC